MARRRTPDAIGKKQIPAIQRIAAPGPASDHVQCDRREDQVSGGLGQGYDGQEAPERLAQHARRQGQRVADERHPA